MLESKECFHCGLPVEEKVNYSLIIDNELRFMCCVGCLAVSKFIIDNNFENYYLHRTGFNKTVDEALFSENEIYDDNFYQSKFVRKKQNFDYLILAIEGITCAACTWLIETHLKKIKGIVNISINLSTCRAHLTLNISDVKISFILNEINKLGYKAYPYLYKNVEKNNKLEYKNELKRLIVAGLGMSQVMMLSASLYIGEGRDLHYLYWNFIRWINFLITTPVLFFSGVNIILNAIRSIKLKVFGMDFTITLSLVLAYFSSLINLLNNSGDVYFDSICMFVFFLLIGRFLEMRARHHSNDIIYSLQELTSGNANLVLKDGKIKNIFIEDVCINDILLIKSGEIVPVDGELIDGSSNFDESMLTGESIPVFKSKGTNVIGGSTNLTNVVLIKATKNKGESTINTILHILDDAFSCKPKANIISDNVANFFVLFVLALTVFVSFLWVIFTTINVLDITLSMLVITCPCALSLAVPVALTSSMSFLTRNGVLVTKSNILNIMGNVSDIIFDKTGTLTLNKFVLKKIRLNDNLISLDFVFSIAFILEMSSRHPIANAFLQSDFNLISLPYSNDDIKSYLNDGIEGKIDGKFYRIGRPSFIKNWVKKYINIKYSGFYIILANKEKILAWFKLSNPLRKNANTSILDIKNINIKPHILSGDSFNNVFDIAVTLNIHNFYSNASFNDKIQYIKSLQKKGSIVMMIGDGMNDAPALSIADVSVSMGSGVDLAKISSDLILLNNDLLKISKSIKHCKKLSKIINQNIFWAIFYNISGLFLASFNLISPYYAALGMSLSSLIVVLNSLRLNRI